MPVRCARLRTSETTSGLCRIAAVAVVASVAGCPMTPDGDGDGDGTGHGDGHTMNDACEDDDECAWLGHGHMCMGGVCMQMDIAPDVVVPPPSEQDIGLVPLVDLDSDPTVFEGHIVIAEEPVEIVPGTMTTAYVYRDASGPARIPGPLIDVVEGTTVRILLDNRLAEPTSVHWHGLVLPVEMDGVPDMPNPPIAPGETFLVEFVARHPALYWYHPHFRSDEQVERGLYGQFRIRSAAEPVVDDERLFAVDDILLDETGAVVPRDDGSAHYETDEGEIRMTFVGMMGRQGNRLLLNGKMNPFVDVRAGSLERWRFANTANSRFFRLALPGHTFIVIGSDGGLLPAARAVDELVLAPSERVDVLVRFDAAPGTEVSLVTRHFDRGHDMADPGDLAIARVRYRDDAPSAALPIPSTTTSIAAIPEGAPAATLVMGEDTIRGGRVGFSFNDELWPAVTPVMTMLGMTTTWEIVNDTHMAHPFHLHGTRFQVTSRSADRETFTPVGSRAWKDTILVEGESALRIAFVFDEPGDWMFHCHIFEHAEMGMMGMTMVE